MNKTDWTKYYNSPYKSSSFTRKITGKILIKTIKKYFGKKDGVVLTEIGGANSAFLELIINEIGPSEYVIVDNNATGLEKTKDRIPYDQKVRLLNQNILKGEFKKNTSDLVLSVGLIEHFDEEGTKKAIKAHFDMLKKDGCAVITFPTPTFLYKIARFIAEKMGLWIFHDERPLKINEVLKTAQKYGNLLDYRIIWPIVFTQGLVVFRKKNRS